MKAQSTKPCLCGSSMFAYANSWGGSPFQFQLGAWGVTSKEYIPSIASNAERWGLRVHGSIIFKVMSQCSVILHQFAMQKEGGSPYLTAVKWFFRVRQLRSAMLMQRMSAGVYWTLDFCSSIKFSTSFEVSFSILCSFGRYPRTLRKSYTFL